MTSTSFTIALPSQETKYEPTEKLATDKQTLTFQAVIAHGSAAKTLANSLKTVPHTKQRTPTELKQINNRYQAQLELHNLNLQIEHKRNIVINSSLRLKRLINEYKRGNVKSIEDKVLTRINWMRQFILNTIAAAENKDMTTVCMSLQFSKELTRNRDIHFYNK